MNHTNPQIEKQLDKLAELCCTSLDGQGRDGQAVVGKEAEALLRALLMSGYGRKNDRSLRADVEARVKDKCAEPAMHRGGALSALTEELQQKFDELERWQSQQPDEHSEPKAANISSATES